MTFPNPAHRGDTSCDEVVLVDGDDRPIGRLGKLETHQRGLRHRAFSVFVRDPASRFLLQQRAMGKYHSGGLWSNTCCGHPRPGEDVDAAARRRLSEEMGLVCPLTFLFSTHYCASVSDGLVENEVVHVFAGQWDGSPDPNPHEVMAWKWATPLAIAEGVKNNPEIFTIWFRKYSRDHGGALFLM